MNALDQSYKHCRRVAKESHSNFYIAFHLLSGKRRMAMDALYAFARIADDSSDGDDKVAGAINAIKSTTGNRNWSARIWHDWVETLTNPGPHPMILELEPIRLALNDSVQQFAIPLSVLHDMIDGIEFDLNTDSRVDSLGDLRRYCRQVASSVGLGCLAIWRPDVSVEIPSEALPYVEACGTAFQLTNILRDVVEDAARDRCYIPHEDLVRFGFTRETWTRDLLDSDLVKTRPHHDVIRVNVERAQGHFLYGGKIASYLSLEGQRMFSLMWKTYHSILREIAAQPGRVFRERVGLPRSRKLGLVATHFFTPLYKTNDSETHLTENTRWVVDEKVAQARRVAVIGGGLAGCNAALHLARHGVNVDLFEARSRLGGRVGSFYDKNANQWVDYCQHVGMKCCSELRRWIDETDQSRAWDIHDSLHFVGRSGKKIVIRSLPLPAPFHLGGLLLQWPGLALSDRMRVASCLVSLMRLKPDPRHDSQLAIDWLRSKRQSDRCLERFWETILVSALGEKITRVTLGAMRKVLIDGFAKTRDAFHLLVPNKPLAALSDAAMRQTFAQHSVTVHDMASVNHLERTDSREWSLVANGQRYSGYDAVVIAIPWHQVSKLMPEQCTGEHSPHQIQSSPISGVHTWWDRDWLNEPHAIFVEGLCQWIFPGKEETNGGQDKNAYYQIVISASHELRNEDPEKTLQRIVEELRTAYPESSKATFLRGKIVTDPQAVFSISPEADQCRWRTAQFGAQNLFVAGDWTKTDWPATMEGALRSGTKAAESVLAALGHPVGIMT
ncbi:hydroxysqualene dehydroxylase HpnE [Pirellulaceae bacterium SH449]